MHLVIWFLIMLQQEFTLVALKTSYISGGACELSSAPFFTVIPQIVIPHIVISHIVIHHVAETRTHIGCT